MLQLEPTWPHACFASRLHDLTHLLIVYPSNPKDKVFGKYYTPSRNMEQSLDGYIAADLKAHVPPHLTAGGAAPASPGSLSIVSIGVSQYVAF